MKTNWWTRLLIFLGLKKRKVITGLFLDDERVPEDVFWVRYTIDVDWTIVRDYELFESAIKQKSFDVMSFDHDLGHKKKTGKDCMNCLIENHLDGNITLPTIIFFHSQNCVGVDNMKSLWYNYQRVVLHYNE